MKRFLFCLVALVLAAALAAPAYAEVKSSFAGAFRVRAMSNDNVSDGNKDLDDNRNRVDQRLRLSYFATASENLRFVYRLEVGDLTWGQPGSVGKGVGGSRGADGVNIETKNAFMQFTLPDTPLRTTLGVQGMALHKGWWLDDDFAAARFDLNFDPFSVMLYWAQHTNSNVTSTQDDIWNTGLSLAYTAEAWNIRGSFGWQHAGKQASAFQDEVEDAGGQVSKDDLYIGMLEGGYKWDWISLGAIGGFNFGKVDNDDVDSIDYKGWMFGGNLDFMFDPFTVGLEGFYVSGDDTKFEEGKIDDSLDSFTYFSGRSHYWAEILGFGTLDRDASTVGDDGPGADAFASGLWAIKLGGTWQALEHTKLTLNAWYAQLSENRPDQLLEDGNSFDDKIGTEVDFYLDQKIMDNLSLRLIGAWLFADKAFDANTNADDDAYEVGARLQMTW